MKQPWRGLHCWPISLLLAPTVSFANGAPISRSFFEQTGNIGGGTRLDFTCIGPAVNLAARLEKITGRLHRTIVASEGFAGICSGGWQDLGEFPIAGFSKAQRAYGLFDEEAVAAA